MRRHRPNSQPNARFTTHPTSQKLMPRVTLVGYRGSGKSAVAAALADRLGCGWCDADVVLEREVGMTITDLVSRRGEQAFRDAEATLLERLLDRESGVLATGGGVVVRDANRELLRARARPVIWLSAPVDVLRARLAADPTTRSRRPALAGGDVLDEVAAAVSVREPLYRQVADGVIDTAIDTPVKLADRIIAWLASPHSEVVP